MARSPEARKRRAAKVSRIVSGRRVVCDVCKVLHPAPDCEPGSEPIGMTVMLPPWLHRELNERGMWGERSPWVVKLIRRELGL